MKQANNIHDQRNRLYDQYEDACSICKENGYFRNTKSLTSHLLEWHRERCSTWTRLELGSHAIKMMINAVPLSEIELKSLNR